MSSTEPRRHAHERHRLLSAPVTPAGGDAAAGVLPLDSMCEILLRLSGKQLCQLRTVCRVWRSLLSAPWFAAAHAARRSEPYVVASYADHVDLDRDSLIDVLDMSGRIVTHVAAGDASNMIVSVEACSGLACIKTVESGSFRLLHPVTGVVHHLLGRLAPEHAARGFSMRDYGEPVHIYGKVGGTSEQKVLRMLPYRRRDSGGNRDDLFEVCTLNSSRSSGARWRGMQGPPKSFVWNEWTMVVVDWVVYFFSVVAYFAIMNR